MSLLVIAYPDLSKTDIEIIENFRREHDKYFNMVRPHFTLVFPVSYISVEDFTAEIKKQLNNFKSIKFTTRCSTISKDAFAEQYHIFLVPDEGNSSIIKLHDKLYDDKLIDNRRLDIDFIPHIGIGHSMDKMVCKKLVDEWNQKDFIIAGTISTVDIVNFENETVSTVEKIKLGEN